VGVFAASIAALALAKANGVPIEYAVLLSVMSAGWSIDHIYDSNYWYNRNLIIIANIERVFLTFQDLRIIHPYFAAHRPTGSFLTHLSIQRNYTIIMTIGVVLYYFFVVVYPIKLSGAELSFFNAIPFISLFLLFIRIIEREQFYNKKYQDFLRNAPGIDLEAKIDYGSSHGGA
jgi:hypothetical protein